MKRVKISVIMLIISVVICLMACQKSEKIDSPSQKVQRLWELDEKVFRPYLQTYEKDSIGRERATLQENGEDYINYWECGSLVITYLCEYQFENGVEERVIQAKEILHRLRNTFEKYGKFPRPEYKDYAYGWVSAMDAPTIMVASQLMYELTEENVWKDFVLQLMQYSYEDIKSGGFNLYFTDENERKNVWPLEYASETITEENAYFVLNGSLVGYLGMKLISEIYPSKEMDNYLKNVAQTYSDFSEKYRYENYNWTYYMLNPLTVIPPHYIIFEKQLYSSISMIDSNSCFEEERDYRIKCLKEVISPHFYVEDNQSKFVLCRACAPHPTLLDVYSTEVVFYDKNDGEITSLINNISGRMKSDRNAFYEGQFLEGTVPANAEKYAVYCIKNLNVKELLHAGEIVYSKATDVEILDVNSKAIFDARFDNDQNIKLDNELDEKSEARIVFELSEIQEKNSQNYYGIEINNLSDEEYNLGLILYDTEMLGASRYYTYLKSGKNLILFNELGFNDINSIKNIHQIVLRVYTDSQQNKADLICGNVLKFEDAQALYSYVGSSKYQVVPE